MNKELIKQLIKQQQQFIEQVELLPRTLNLEEAGNYVFVGIRRAGKSYMLYQHIQSLLVKGHSINEILYINFEDERIADIKSSELNLILESYYELFQGEPLVFLDEIQNIKGWEKFARRLADEKRKVFITGSNAQMLSREIATTLGGRYLIEEVYPFDFSEFLRYEKIQLTSHWEYSSVQGDVVRIFENYFNFGGFPEVIQYTDKRSWLTSLYQKIFLSDIIARNDIRNEQMLRLLVRKLAENVLQPASVQRLKNILEGTGNKIARNTISEYLKYLQDAYLVFSISNFTDKISERESYKKHYFYDNGILNLFLYQPETKLLENLVAIVLWKKYKERLYYYIKNVEVDFFIPEEQIAIQVSYSITDDVTFEREVNALKKIAQAFDIQKLYIITKNQEKEIELENATIKVIPIWKWLLI
jgi:uncharacterized protein